MKTKLITLSSIFALTFQLSAVTIVGFNDGTTAQAGASTLDSDLTSATLDFGPGLIKPETGADDFFVGGDPQGTIFTLQNALDNNYYYSITITPGIGQQVDYDSVTIATFSQNDLRTFYLFSDLTGFTATDSLGSFEQPLTTISAAGTPNMFSLAGDGLDSVTTPVEFRIYYSDEDSPSTFDDSGFRAPGSGLDFVSVDGTLSAVPEPSNLILVAFGSLMLASRRVRSRN